MLILRWQTERRGDGTLRDVVYALIHNTFTRTTFIRNLWPIETVVKCVCAWEIGSLAYPKVVYVLHILRRVELESPPLHVARFDWTTCGLAPLVKVPKKCPKVLGLTTSVCFTETVSGLAPRYGPAPNLQTAHQGSVAHSV